MYSKVEIFTDGACGDNSGVGGWGAVIRYSDGREEEIHGSEEHTTNNRMELSAAINALRHLPAPTHVDLTINSRYVQDGITKWIEGWKRNGWKTKQGKAVKNIDLWQDLEHQVRRHRVTWRTGHKENKRADKLARQGVKDVRSRVNTRSDSKEGLIESFVLKPEPEWVYSKVEIFTDGACSGNPGVGGWGAVIRYSDGREEEIHGAEEHTTNNRMELSAAINALRHLQAPARVILTTDSRYVKDGITKWIEGWKRKGWKTADSKAVKNINLWQDLERLVRWHRVTWQWVEGHTGHKENERADKLARRGVKDVRSRANTK